MNKSILFATMLASMITMTSCTNDMANEPVVTNQQAKVKLTIQGIDIAVSPSLEGKGQLAGVGRGWAGVGSSRASLSANGTSLTDLYIIDYVNGKPSQTLHQVSTDADFAEPELTLAFGTHEIRVIATRSTQHTVIRDASDDPTLLTFGKVSDTFTGSLTIQASAGTVGSQTVTLDRAVARLQLTMKDVVPSDAATIVTEIDTHYNTIGMYDFSVSSTALHHSEVSLSSIRGKTDQKVLVYSLAPETQWQSDVHITTLRTDNTAISDFTLADVPMYRNHTTVVSGEFFQRTNAFTFTINDEWAENIEYNF